MKHALKLKCLTAGRLGVLLALVLRGTPALCVSPVDPSPAQAMIERWRSVIEAPGSRAPGLPGNRLLEATVADTFAASGFDHGVLRMESPVFMPGELRIRLPDGRDEWLLPMHPTLLRPGNFADETFEAPLVYLGRGRPEDLDRVRGHPLAGSLAVMEFDCGDRWLDLLRFGVRGFVFLAADNYHPADAVAKVYNSEVAVPRFFAPEPVTETLREAFRDAQRLPVHVQATPSVMRRRILGSPWVLIPGSDPERGRDVIMLTAPLDANSVVPDLAHGGEQAVNLMLLLDLLEDWRRTPPDRSVLLVAVNAHTQSYLGERVLAWSLLNDMAGLTEVRDRLAREMRTAQLFAERYRGLRLDPVTLAHEKLGPALDILWALHGREPAGQPAGVDDDQLRSAIDAAIRRVAERQRGVMARMTFTDDDREQGEVAQRRLADLRNAHPDAVRELLRAAAPVFHDEQLLEAWRTEVDTSTGVRLAVKSRLQDAVQRELNRVKQELMDRSRDPDPDEAVMMDLRTLREDLTPVLVLFNKIDIGVGRTRVRYRDIAMAPTSRRLLIELRDRMVTEHQDKADRFRELLERDMANAVVRDVLGARQVRLAIALGMNGSAERSGFMALNHLPRQIWYRRLGGLLAEAAAGVTMPGQDDGPYVDALTGAGGVEQESFFMDHHSPAGVFQAAGGVPSLVLRSAFTPSRHAFTPRNRLTDLDADAVYRRHQWYRTFLSTVVDLPDLTASAVVSPLPVGANDRLWTCLLRSFEMDEFAAKPTPSLPVPQALIAAYMTGVGVLPSIVDGDVTQVFGAMTDETGHALMVGIWRSPLAPLVYRLDDQSVAVTATIDKGRIQESQLMDSNLYRTPSKTFPMFRAAEFMIGNRVDPSLVSHRAIRVDQFWPISGNSKSDPQKFGVHGASSLSRALSHQSSGPIGLYPEFRARRNAAEPLIILTGNMRFVVNPTEDEPEGIGYASASALGHDFFFRAAQDMEWVTRHRVSQMPGVVNELVDEFVDAGRAAATLAAAARDRHDYPAYRRAVITALGNQVKAYHQVRGMNADMLKAILVYMALMLPFCYFLQKLFFSFNRIEHELSVFALLFVLMFIGFRLIHPAFSIAMSPEAIFLAFVLGAIGCFVTWMLHGRFSAEMDILFRGMTGFTGDAAAGFVGQTAMLIGVNNMKRRRTRTFLTTATVVLVVFTMLAFSSISQKVRPILVPRAPDAPYTGLFYTWPGAALMDEDTPRVFETLFAGRAEMLVRRVAQAGGATRWRIERRDEPGQSAFVSAILSLSPNEAAFVGPLPFTQGRLFTDDDSLEIILPASLAEALEIAPHDLERVQLRFHGQDLTVVGILDDDRYRMQRDLDPRFPLLPRMATADDAPVSGAMALADVGDTGLDLASMVFLPPEVCRLLGGRPFSISVRLPDRGGEDADRDLWTQADRLLRATDAVFTLGSVEPFRVGADARRTTEAGVYRISGAYRTSIGGLARLVIPLMIAGMLLFNTMLGTVQERKPEIAIYNAIGLNPRHIFAFFLAEALVYGVIGAIGGYLIGQILAILAQTFQLVRGLNVNFSSLMVVWAILFTIGLVLLSTVYPAYVATRTAVPSGTRRWTMPPTDGERMSLDMPFIYEPSLAPGVMAYLHEHFEACTEESLGDMLATVRSLEVKTDAGQPAYHAEYGVALAPYDLGVTQAVRIDACFDPDLDSYRLNIDLQRESGQDTSWVAVNQSMLERLRKLLLRWRNMDPSQREAYVAMSRKHFES